MKDRTIALVAASYDPRAQTVGNWVARYKKEHAGDHDHKKASESAEIAKLWAENRELRQENELCELINWEEGYCPVSSMCRWAEVSRSGYYSWRETDLSPSPG